MSFCTHCGSQLKDENQKFCGKCGARLDLGPISQNQDVTTPPTSFLQREETQELTSQPAMQNQYYQPGAQAQNENPARPMKWYKFLIYFALFAGGVINLYYGIIYISGMIYNIQGGGQAYADMVYNTFMGLKGLDVVFGILSILLAGLCVYTRFRLSQYRKDGPLFVYITYAVNGLITIIYSIVLANITGINQIAKIIVTVVVLAVAIVLNVIYFNKRKDLFVN